MKKLNKIWAVILAVTLALVVCVIPSAALTIENEAVAIKSGSTYKAKFIVDENNYYKITLSKKGELNWGIYYEAARMDMRIFDSNGKEVAFYYSNGEIKCGVCGQS